jgi:hypothetical protein
MMQAVSRRQPAPWRAVSSAPNLPCRDYAMSRNLSNDHVEQEDYVG